MSPEGVARHVVSDTEGAPNTHASLKRIQEETRKRNDEALTPFEKILNQTRTLDDIKDAVRGECEARGGVMTLLDRDEKQSLPTEYPLTEVLEMIDVEYARMRELEQASGNTQLSDAAWEELYRTSHTKLPDDRLRTRIAIVQIPPRTEPDERIEALRLAS